MRSRLREIEALGQSIWIDNISRQLLEDGIMARLVEEDRISGVTSNPTIFERVMGHSDRYDDAFRNVIDESEDPQEIFERLGYLDIRDAADLLRPTFEKTHGEDGYASFEVPAAVAFDARKTLEELVDEGVKSFSDSYQSLLDAINDKASELAHAS